ncbi:MAG TPA: ATP-dependent metallopeptidase FtsH/Yme1/Tma family protein, partial [Thermoleophilaceae bacterium]|nr:ATP-dependent metallopeptidase FtsH/Yme1/Tma family protein [Thermoleophilaceae bacterium]
MSRFFKSALFPILIVIVLVFFARELISPNDKQPDPVYTEFLAQLDSGKVKEVTLNTKNNRIDVTLKPQRGGEPSKYRTAYPDNTEPSLVNALRAENVPIEVKAKSGSGWSTALIYIL